MPGSTWANGGSTVSKGKSFGVGTQKHDEMTESVSSWVSVPVMYRAFVSQSDKTHKGI